MSVKRICENGNRVCFGPNEGDNYVVNVTTKKKVPLRPNGKGSSGPNKANAQTWCFRQLWADPFFLFPSMRSQGIIPSTSSNNHKTNHALGSTRENQLTNLPHTSCPKQSGLTEGLLLGPWEFLHRVHTCCTESKKCFRVL